MAAQKKKKSRKQQKQQSQYFKQRMRQALYGFYTISMVFLVLVVLSLSFLLYQWKEYKITELAKEIQQLKAEILKLSSENNRYQSKINTRLEVHHRIAEIVKQRLDLEPAIQEPIVFKVDKDKLQYYVQKDQEEKK